MVWADGVREFFFSLWTSRHRRFNVSEQLNGTRYQSKGYRRGYETFGGYDVIRPPRKNHAPSKIGGAGPRERQKTAENEGFFEKTFVQQNQFQKSKG